VCLLLIVGPPESAVQRQRIAPLAVSKLGGAWQQPGNVVGALRPTGRCVDGQASGLRAAEAMGQWVWLPGRRLLDPRVAGLGRCLAQN
jgi:hypothetical protein